MESVSESEEVDEETLRLELLACVSLVTMELVEAEDDEDSDRPTTIM